MSVFICRYSQYSQTSAECLETAVMSQSGLLPCYISAVHCSVGSRLVCMYAAEVSFEEHVSRGHSPHPKG